MSDQSLVQMQKQMISHSVDTITVSEGGIPYFYIGFNPRQIGHDHLQMIINFLRCGCSAVQLGITNDNLNDEHWDPFINHLKNQLKAIVGGMYRIEVPELSHSDSSADDLHVLVIRPVTTA